MAHVMTKVLHRRLEIDCMEVFYPKQGASGCAPDPPPRHLAQCTNLDEVSCGSSELGGFVPVRTLVCSHLTMLSTHHPGFVEIQYSFPSRNLKPFYLSLRRSRWYSESVACSKFRG